MRAVNLIPSDQRRSGGTTRGSVVGYGAIGLLAALLIGVIALVQTGNEIDERKAEIASLEQQQQVVAARLATLRPYSEFAALAEAREQTIRQLAQSRFDWERVLNELALVLPEDVWLTQLTGTAGPDVQVESGAEVSSRAGIQAPALEIIGCAASQDAVANFVSVLRDIDGVTRVGLDASERPDSTSGSGATGGGATGDDCRTRSFIPQFQLVVAFDGASAAVASASEGAAPAAPAPETTSPAPETTSADPAAEVQGEQQATRNSFAAAADGADKAADIPAEVTP